jgi:hypothetical protein
VSGFGCQEGELLNPYEIPLGRSSEQISFFYDQTERSRPAAALKPEH